MSRRNYSFSKNILVLIPDIGFLYEVDGLEIFDGNSYMSTNEVSSVEAYRKGNDSLKDFRPIDIAILHVRTDARNAYEPYLYLIDQLSPGSSTWLKVLMIPKNIQGAPTSCSQAILK